MECGFDFGKRPVILNDDVPISGQKKEFTQFCTNTLFGKRNDQPRWFKLTLHRKFNLPNPDETNGKGIKRRMTEGSRPTEYINPEPIGEAYFKLNPEPAQSASLSEFLVKKAAYENQIGKGADLDRVYKKGPGGYPQNSNANYSYNSSPSDDVDRSKTLGTPVADRLDVSEDSDSELWRSRRRRGSGTPMPVDRGDTPDMGQVLEEAVRRDEEFDATKSDHHDGRERGGNLLNHGDWGEMFWAQCSVSGTRLAVEAQLQLAPTEQKVKSVGFVRISLKPS